MVAFITEFVCKCGRMMVWTRVTLTGDTPTYPHTCKCGNVEILDFVYPSQVVKS